MRALCWFGLLIGGFISLQEITTAKNWLMDDEGHVVVDAQFKFILKKILENLRLSATSNECENMV